MKNWVAITLLVVGCMSVHCPRCLFDSLLNPDRDRTGIRAEDQVDEGNIPDVSVTRRPAEKSYIPNAKDIEILSRTVIHKIKNVFEAVYDAFRPPSYPDGFDIPVVINASVRWYIHYFKGPKRESFAQWLVGARRYEPTVRDILKKNNLPEDLVYVAMIESGFNLKARSRAQAVGPWQFMDQTGRQYGLRVDYWVDERYDLEKSTVAAARYFRKLFEQFGCWYLAAAGYNAGENRVKKAVEYSKKRDFWELRRSDLLPEETREYIPRLMAAAVIAKDPERYGFTRKSTAIHKSMKAHVPGGVPLDKIALTFSVNTADLKVLNPELLQNITPPGRMRYGIRLPDDKKTELAIQKIKDLNWGKRVVRVLEHRVRAKDTLPAIERLYKVSGPDLLLVNAGGLQIDRVQILYIPFFSTAKTVTKNARGRGVPKTSALKRWSKSSRDPARRVEIRKGR